MDADAVTPAFDADLESVDTVVSERNHFNQSSRFSKSSSTLDSDTVPRK